MEHVKTALYFSLMLIAYGLVWVPFVMYFNVPSVVNLLISMIAGSGMMLLATHLAWDDYY